MPAKQHPDKLQLTLTLNEINLVLEALGQLPFARVHEVVGQIQRQAQQQLQETSAVKTQPKKTR